MWTIPLCKQLNVEHEHEDIAHSVRAMGSGLSIAKRQEIQTFNHSKIESIKSSNIKTFKHSNIQKIKHSLIEHVKQSRNQWLRKVHFSLFEKYSMNECLIVLRFECFKCLDVCTFESSNLWPVSNIQTFKHSKNQTFKNSNIQTFNDWRSILIPSFPRRGLRRLTHAPGCPRLPVLSPVRSSFRLCILFVPIIRPLVRPSTCALVRPPSLLAFVFTSLKIEKSKSLNKSIIFDFF